MPERLVAHRHEWIMTATAVAILVAAAVGPWLPVMNAGFYLDDEMLIEHARDTPAPAALTDAWPLQTYRPLVTLAFDAMQPFFGSNPRGYHALSIVLHVLNTLLALALAYRISSDRLAAVLAALLFAVLPSHLEAIGWIASVGDLMAAGLLVITVLTALAAADGKPPGRIAWTGLSLLSAVAACSAKESALVVAVLAPASAWFFAKTRPGWRWMVLHPAVTLAWLAWRSTRAGAPLSLDILAIVGPHVSLYMGAKKLLLTVLPVLRDAADRVLTPTSGWTWLLMTAVWISVVALAARSASASNRTQLFGWLWILAALVPVWWLPYQGRFTYLPSVGAALIAAGLLRDLDWRGRPAVAAGLAVLFLVCLTASAVSAVSWAGGGP